MKIGKRLSWLIDMSQEVQKTIETEINATPTGESRNKLCDANIHILEAIKLLKETEPNEATLQL